MATMSAGQAMNFSLPEAAILARLTDKLMTTDACVRAVLTAPELAAVAEERQAAPAVYLVYDGPQFQGGEAAAYRVTVVHRWIVTVAVASVARMRESASRHSEAAGIIPRVFDALYGWRPLPGWRALEPFTPPKPVYSPGFAYFPLGFQTSATGAALAQQP